MSPVANIANVQPPFQPPHVLLGQQGQYGYSPVAPLNKVALSSPAILNINHLAPQTTPYSLAPPCEKIVAPCNLSHKFQPKNAKNYMYAASSINVSTLQIVQSKGLTIAPTITSVKTPPTSFSVSVLPSILNQGNLGDCVANAFYYCIMSKTQNVTNLSRLCLYAICRSIDFTPLNQDNGTMISTACAAIARHGVCKENFCPYNINNYASLPPLVAFQNLKLFDKFTYSYINQTALSIKSCLSTNNVPIIFGTMVYSSFMTNTVAANGIIPMPNIAKETLEGGHCMVITGYNDSTQMFTCANSWGTSWGKKGYCYIPYAYMTNANLVGDLCFITFVNCECSH